ncbi:MAG: hypothetical protein M1816_001463 [Peltula sp. TS41687]|nr:MAG: hypothetical protein M1816_001463 [Peltula sp. TS41687]
MAYKQYSWLRMRKRPTTIGGIDSILGSLEDFSALVDIDYAQTETLERRVPEINWANLSTQTGGFGYWNGAGQDLFRLTTTTAYGMAALPMTPVYNNYSYTFEFLAPALTCGSIRPGAQTAFNEVLGGDWEASPTQIRAQVSTLMGCPEIKPAIVMFQAGIETAPLVHDYYCRNGTLEKAIEDLSRNVTFSLFGYANGLLPSNETSPRPITRAFTANIYAYSGKILLYSYGAGIVLTLLILVFGAHAMIANGAVHNSDFSGIMCATSNPDFDRIARGWCLTAEPVGKEVKRVKVQFGVLGEDSNRHDGNEKGDGLELVEHAAFGLEGTVRKVRKGEKLSAVAPS